MNRFLTSQYYETFNDDAEVPFLRRLGLFSNTVYSNAENNNIEVHKVSNKFEIDNNNFNDYLITTIDNNKSTIKLPVKILKKRLELFLKIFSVITSPKQLYCHQLLYNFYHELLSKPDVNIAKIAYECILTYKPINVIPYKENIKRLLDDKTIRDELVNFDLSTEADVVKVEHRNELIPIVIRIAYGRFVSKSRGSKAARDQSLSRFIIFLITNFNCWLIFFYYYKIKLNKFIYIFNKNKNNIK
jgi:hypothetical protein